MRKSGEIQPAHDADLLSHVTMHLSHFRIARRLDQRAVESLVQLGHPPAIQQAPLRRRVPDVAQGLQQILPSARAHRRSTAASSSTMRRSYSASKRSKSKGACQRGLASTKPSRSSRARPNRGVRLTPSRAAGRSR